MVNYLFTESAFAASDLTKCKMEAANHYLSVFARPPSTPTASLQKCKVRITYFFAVLLIQTQVLNPN